jgi:hypothetical protein
MDPVSISIEFNSSRSELSIEVCWILGLSKALKFGKKPLVVGNSEKTSTPADNCLLTVIVDHPHVVV